MSDELRHCVYCRDAGREHALSMNASPRQGGNGEMDFCVTCLMCSARGPRMPTEEEAIAVWNAHTESTVEAVSNASNMELMVGMLADWKAKAEDSNQMVEGLSSILTDAMDLMSARTAQLVASVKDADDEEGEELP